MQRVTHYQLNKRRAGTHHTKTQGEISGTTRKPWKQKGTGRARAGSLRLAHHRGGATVFGPRTRSHATKLPKKVRALGLKMALSAKQKAGELIIIDSLDLKAPKTKEIAQKIEKLVGKSALFIAGEAVNENFAKATKNLPNIDALPTIGANVYDILNHEKLVLTTDSVKGLEARLS